LWSVKIVEGNFIRSVSFTWSPSGLRGELRKAKYIKVTFFRAHVRINVCIFFVLF